MRKLLACSAVGVVVFGGVLAACGGGGGGGGSQQAFCDALKKEVSAFSDLSDQSDLTNSQSQSLLQTAFDDLANKAPSEIKGDMQTLAKAIRALGESADELSSAVSDSDFSKLSDLEQSFSDQNSGFEKASQNVETYAKDKCGIDISGSDSSSSTRSSGSSSLSSLSSSLSDRFSDLSDLSNFSDLSDLSSLSDLSDLTSNFSDLSSFSDFSSLGSELSSLFSR
ncbi:MAG TPA: hypothetical protein VHI95_01400 [Acidimicrobiales bacterium]|nr:hypothetical protein [Acidimicrobiales bacterium]